jgi:hypothetical protein
LRRARILLGSKVRFPKISGSGLKVTRVPVLPLGAGPTTWRGSVTSPRLKAMRWCLPSRKTSTTVHSERALTTLAPTPWRPPETL